MGRIDALWAGGDLVVADELYSANLAVNGEPSGPDDVKAVLGMFRTAFSDMSFEIKEQFAVGDLVVTRLEQSGTHTGPLESPLGVIPPTGRTFTIGGIEIHRIADGKVADAWAQFDLLGLYQALGALPAVLSSPST